MKPKTYSCELEVRGYELDSFGHVNHSVYVNYLEHARWKLLEEEKITLKDFATWKTWPVIASLEAQYLKPLFLGDRIQIQSQIVEHGKTNFSVEQRIVLKGEEVFRGRVRIVMVNDKGKPTGMTDAMSKLWENKNS